MKNFRACLTSVLILASLCLPSSALEIDLTSFSSGDSSTHSHTYSQKYDSSKHWQECTLCGTKKDEEVHVLTTKDTYTKLCNPRNVRITSCSLCAYSLSLAYREGTCSNILSYLKYHLSGNYVYPQYVCSNCGSSTYGGPQTVEYYTDGTQVDWYNIDSGKQIYREGRDPFQVTGIYYDITYGALDGRDLNMVLSEDKLTLSLKGKLYIPQAWIDEYNDVWRAHSPGNVGVIYLEYMLSDYPNSPKYYYFTLTDAHIQQGWVPIDLSYSVCDMTRDEFNSAAIRYSIQSIYYEGAYTKRLYTNNQNRISVPFMYYREPSISSLVVS